MTRKRKEKRKTNQPTKKTNKHKNNEKQIEKAKTNKKTFKICDYFFFYKLKSKTNVSEAIQNLFVIHFIL